MVWNTREMATEIINLMAPSSSINLGIGLPTIIPEMIPPEMNLMIHSENGVLGVKGRPEKKDLSPTLINAGKETIAISKGASFFDSATSFGMIRGGHIDYCVLGGMEVDIAGNLANWMIPGKKITGMGGAMDLVNGAKNIIIMMTHFNKSGAPKLVEECTLPLTGKNVVNTIVSDHGIFQPVNNRFEIIKLAKDVSIDGLKIDRKFLEI